MFYTRLFIKSSLVASSLFLITSCMSSTRQEELDAKISRLQDKVDRLSNKDMSSADNLDTLQNQLQIAQGNIDELNVRVKRIEESAGINQVAPAGNAQNSQTVPDRNAQSSQAAPAENTEALSADGENADQDQKKKTLKKASTETHISSTRTGKLPHNIKTAADADSVLKEEFENGNFKKVISTSSAILNAKGATKSMLATALDYRGESQFQLRNYHAAANDLSAFIGMHIKSTRYPRALLLAGDSFVYLKKNSVALPYYQECAKNYRSRPEGKAAASRIASMRKQSRT